MKIIASLCWQNGKYVFISPAGGPEPQGEVYAKIVFEILNTVGDLITESGITLSMLSKALSGDPSILQKSWFEVFEDTLFKNPANDLDYRMIRMQFASQCMFQTQQNDELPEDTGKKPFTVLFSRAGLTMEQHIVFHQLGHMGQKIPSTICPVCTPKTEDYLLANHSQIATNKEDSSNPWIITSYKQRSDVSKMSDIFIVITCILLLICILTFLIILYFVPPHTI